jgi:hypothetical protein
MILQSTLEQMKDVDIRTVDKAALQDVSGFRFDNSLSKEERAAQIFKLTKNPYCFRYGDTAVKVEFADNGPPLQDVMSGFLIRQKSGL